MQGEPILEVRDLTVSFGGVNAVDHVTVSVPAGMVTSVIGPNGAGKSTLLNLLSGALAPSEGRVRLAGQDVTGWPAYRLRRVGLARSFQISSLFPELSVLENVRLATQRLERRTHLVLSLEHSRRAQLRADELLAQFGLSEVDDALAGELSHGEQRRLEIAMCLADRPQLLLLDEPTQGMSHGDTQQVASIIRRLAAEMSVMVVEHDVDLVMSISDRVIVLHQGHLLAEGTAQEVRSNPAVRKAYLGEA